METRLVDRPHVTRECIPLIAAIFSSRGVVGAVQDFSKDDAQAFIDKTAEVPPHALSSPKNGPTDILQIRL